jgi:hypothetical protein
MSTQYRLVQSGKTASGGCSSGQGSSEPVAPRIFFRIVHQEALCSKIIKMNRTMKMFVSVNLFVEETKLKDTEHSLHFWKKCMPIMVIFPYILSSDSWARENVCSVFALKERNSSVSSN